MPNINTTILAGHLGRDPEFRATASGQEMATLSVATTRRWKNRDGEWSEETTWHRVVLWGRDADVARTRLHKGDPVMIEGRLSSRNWEDRQGEKRTTVEVVAERLHLLRPKSDEDGRARDQGAQQRPGSPTSDPMDLPF